MFTRADSFLSTRPRKGTTVLVIDDSPTIRDWIAKTLQRQGLFEHYLEARHGFEGLRVAASQPVDLILCDVEMPELDGFGFLAQFRRDVRNHPIPVLLLSGSGSSDKKVEGFGRGANDYIVKPCDRAELCARVKNYLDLKLLQDELRLKNAELAEMAITDPLTSLHNRRHFLTRATDEVRRSRRHQHPLGLLMIDVDHFKRVNDTFGHQQGDAVLVRLARVFRESLRGTDLLARFGGEEFVACLPETPRAGALLVANKLRRAVEDCEIVGMDRPSTVSIGLSFYPAEGAESLEILLRLADDALYRAKANGRNRVEVTPL